MIKVTIWIFRDYFYTYLVQKTAKKLQNWTTVINCQFSKNNDIFHRFNAATVTDALILEFWQKYDLQIT